MLGGEQMPGVRVRTDGNILFHSQRYHVTHVGNSILAFLAVLNEQFARIQVNVTQMQRANFTDPQPAVPQQIETGEISNGQYRSELCICFHNSSLNSAFQSANLFCGLGTG